MTIAIDDALNTGAESSRIEKLLKAEGHHIIDWQSDEPFDLLLHYNALNLPKLNNGVPDWKQIHKALRDGGYLPTTKYPCTISYKMWGEEMQDIAMHLTQEQIIAIKDKDQFDFLDEKLQKDLQFVDIQPDYD